MVWADQDLFKVGLSSGRNARDVSAVRSIHKYFDHAGVTPGSFIEWRAELPALEGAAWGDCQRVEMVVATAVKRRLGASAAGAVGLEWLTREDLQLVAWKDELTAAAVEALPFSGLEPRVEWSEYTPGRASDTQISGAPQRDAWRTTRNWRGQCAMKECGAALTDHAALQDGFLYCSDAHAALDLVRRATGRREE